MLKSNHFSYIIWMLEIAYAKTCSSNCIPSQFTREEGLHNCKALLFQKWQSIQFLPIIASLLPSG